jgi:hypothetical protein
VRDTTDRLLRSWRHTDTARKVAAPTQSRQSEPADAEPDNEAQRRTLGQ